MSISNPKLEHPCKKFIDFKGDSGIFVYWDKEGEKQVEIPIPIYFIVLDELATISGYCKKHDCGIYSNEVHRTNDELLKVKTFSGGEEITGLYSDIKDSVVALGGKYTKSVYALLIKADKSTEMVNFKFRGASFSGWLEKKFNVDQAAIGITGLKGAVNGKINYQIPVFQKFAMTPELRERAIAADEILQEYLTEYFKSGPQKSTETVLPEHIARRIEPSNPLIDEIPTGKLESKDQYASFVPEARPFYEPEADPDASYLDDLPF